MIRDGRVWVSGPDVAGDQVDFRGRYHHLMPFGCLWSMLGGSHVGDHWGWDGSILMWVTRADAWGHGDVWVRGLYCCQDLC